jgi:hypothetical protein
MIAELAFVPTFDVPAAFEELADASPNELIPGLDYFEDNYVGRENRRAARGRREPLFPVELWNMFDRVTYENNKRR